MNNLSLKQSQNLKASFVHLNPNVPRRSPWIDCWGDCVCSICFKKKTRQNKTNAKGCIKGWFYYTVNLSPSIIIRDAVILKWAVMQWTKCVTFTHTCTLTFFFLSFSKISLEILAHYRNYTFGHSRSL